MGPAVLGPICLGAVTALAGPSRRWRRAVLTAAWPARGLHVPRASVPTFAVKPVLDFAYWAEHAEEAQRNADNRRFKCDVQAVVAAHSEYRAQLHEIKLARERRNAHSRLLKGKLAPEERQRLIEEGREIKDRLLELEASAAELGERLTAQALPIPNRSHPAVPVGAEEAAVVRRTCGTPRTSATVGFPVRDHLELGRGLGLFDFEAGGQVSGQKFLYYHGGAALLELALVQWSMHEAVKRGFKPVMPPDLVRDTLVAGCGFTPRDDEATQIYTVAGTDLCLAGTAEIPLAGIFMNKTLIDGHDLPQRLVAFGHAFRTEAGSSGSENRGIYRLHQFSKVELFAVTRGDTEESNKMLEEIRQLEEDLFEQLGLCYRVLDMPTEELGAPAYRKFDIEAWMPGMQKWGEISSCSSCTDYQARRLNIRHKETYSQKGDLTFAHTLNGTACAVPRMIISILETFQNEDGSVTVPEVLRPYMMGIGTLRPE